MLKLNFFSRGDWSKTEDYLKYLNSLKFDQILAKYGAIGVEALASATPKDTGLTASSWKYKVNKTTNGYSLEWYNTNVNRGENIALLIQYGHGTGWGGYVRPNDYINPAMRPVFEKISDEIWRELNYGN